MYKICVLLGLIHFIGVALTLKTLQFILPEYASCCFTCASHFFMCIVIAKVTFGFMKEKILNSRIQPSGKAVLITGCDSGFGNGLAKQLDAKGFHVFASCLLPEGKGAEELRKSCSSRLQILPLDVSIDDSVKAAVDFVKSNLGNCELWAVVNNAGVLKGFSTEVSGIQYFKDSMDVNGFGVVRVTKAFLPMLKKSKGRVVNVTSIAGRMAAPHFSPYTMSKFAAEGFSECVRREVYAWGVRVITVQPEAFQTGMTKKENLISGLTTFENDFISTYGEKYLKDFKKFFERGDKYVSPKTSKVLNDLLKAVSLKHPDAVYQPSRNALLQNSISLFLLLPNVMQDLLLAFVFYLIKWPTPEPQKKHQ